MITVRPADRVGWDEVAAVFGERGTSARCFCQRYKLPRGEAFKHHPPSVRAARLCGQAAAGSGLVAFEDEVPVGWCALEPRPAYDGLVRNGSRPAWAGRDEDRTDPGIWAVTCFLVRIGHRRRGVGRALAAGAVEHARAQGARALEGYPMTTTANALSEELHVGTVGMFAAAGLVELSRPSLRRAVMRIDF